MRGPLRRLSILVLVAGTLVVACGGEDGAEAPVDDADGGDSSGSDTPDVEVDDTTVDDVIAECESGFTCVRTTDCAGSGMASPTCAEGCCVEATPGTCAAHLDPCSSDDQTSADIFCDTTEGICLTKCDYDAADDTRSSDCPLNSYCLSELTDVEPDELNGLCIPGDCDSDIFDPEACGGAGTCRPVGNGASFCVEAGTAGEGDPCGLDDSDSPPASDICSPGMLCFENNCIVPCDRRDADCPDGLECTRAFDTTPRNQPGVCATECGEFSGGECDGGVCRVVSGRFGINTWLCSDAPEEPLAEGADCSGAGADCAEGLICVRVTETERVCRQICDPIGAAAGTFANCPGGAIAGPEVIGATAFGEASAYWEADEDGYALEIRAADSGAFLGPIEVRIEEGVVKTAVIAGADAVDVFTIDDFAGGDEPPEQGLRIVHALGDLGEVDVYLRERIGEGTRPNDPLSWISLPAGDYELGAVDDQTTETLVAGNAYYVPFYDAYQVETITPEQAALAGIGEAGLRFFHAGRETGPVDIWFGCTVADGSFADCVGHTPSPAALVGGAATQWRVLDVGELNGATWYVTAAGADPAASAPEAVLATGVLSGFNEERLHLVTLYDGLESPELAVDTVVFAEDEGRFTAALHDLGVAESLVLDQVSGPVEEALEYRDASVGEGSAWLAVDLGWYGFDLQLVDGTWWSTDVREVLEGDLLTVFVAGSVEGEARSLTAFETVDGFESPGDGVGAGRLVHANASIGAVTLNQPGEADVVCTPSRLSGFGFCQEACVPYPRREDYGCDEADNTCLPFVSRDDRVVLPLGYCREDSGFASSGEACSDDGFLGNDCLDFAVCLTLADTDTAQCLPLCEPFSQGACGEFGTCSGVPPLVGQLNFSFCMPNAQAGQIGDPCVDAGLPCEADNSICLELSGSAECFAVCREGFDDCAEHEGTCAAAGLNPDVVPTYMGLCR